MKSLAVFIFKTLFFGGEPFKFISSDMPGDSIHAVFIF